MHRRIRGCIVLLQRVCAASADCIRVWTETSSAASQPCISSACAWSCSGRRVRWQSAGWRVWFVLSSLAGLQRAFRLEAESSSRGHLSALTCTNTGSSWEPDGGLRGSVPIHYLSICSYVHQQPAVDSVTSRPDIYSSSRESLCSLDQWSSGYIPPELNQLVNLSVGSVVKQKCSNVFSVLYHLKLNIFKIKHVTFGSGKLWLTLIFYWLID